MSSRLEITGDDLGPLLAVMSWLLLCLIALAVSLRGGIRLYFLRRLTIDDGLMLTSSLFALGQTIAFWYATQNGLGRRIELIAVIELQMEMKAQYSSDLLFVMSIFFAKATIIRMLYTLSKNKLHRRAAIFIGSGIFFWTIAYVFVFAFSCRPPRPWDYTSRSCQRLEAANLAYSTINMISEVALLVLPFTIIGGLNTKLRDKTVVLLTFSGRILVIIAIALEIAYTREIQFSGDRTYTTWKAALCRQTVQCSCIIATCVIYMRPFMDMLDSGFVRVDDLRRRGEGNYSANKRSKTSKTTSSSWSATRRNDFPNTSEEQDAYALGSLSDVRSNSGHEHLPQSNSILATHAFSVESHRIPTVS